MKNCWVGVLRNTVTPIRIFKSLNAAIKSGDSFLQMPYFDAVKSIRKQIFYRSKGFCELCGAIVLESSGQMHEQKHRGKGGEISLENSVFICPTCHTRAHSDRNPRFSKKNHDTQ